MKTLKLGKLMFSYGTSTGEKIKTGVYVWKFGNKKTHVPNMQVWIQLFSNSLYLSFGWK